MRHILELTGFETGSGRAVRLVGGSTRNATWNQIRADWPVLSDPRLDWDTALSVALLALKRPVQAP